MLDHHTETHSGAVTYIQAVVNAYFPTPCLQPSAYEHPVAAARTRCLLSGCMPVSV